MNGVQADQSCAPKKRKSSSKPPYGLPAKIGVDSDPTAAEIFSLDVCMQAKRDEQRSIREAN